MSIKGQFLQIKKMFSQNPDSNLSEKKGKFILLEFTRELIRQSGGEILKPENILKKDVKKNRKKRPLLKTIKKKEIEKPPQEIKTNEKEEKILKQGLEIFTRPKPLPIRRMSPKLFIPKQRLPQKFQYLKPTPTNIEINLGILNSLIEDPMVKNIECNGPNQNVLVTGTMGRKKTNIFLSKEEIDEVVKKFSEATKIPSHEGVFRVVAGKLIFSAIISNLIGSKFIIKKMMYNSGFRR